MNTFTLENDNGDCTFDLNAMVDDVESHDDERDNGEQE